MNDPSTLSIADEQRARSAEIEAMGVNPWVAANDQREPRIPGSWKGSARSTPEARAAQNPAATR